LDILQNNLIHDSFFNPGRIIENSRTAKAVLLIKTVGNRRRQLTAYGNFALSRVNFGKVSSLNIFKVIETRDERTIPSTHLSPQSPFHGRGMVWQPGTKV